MMKCMILREDGKRAKFNRVYFYSHLKRFSWQHILPPIPASPTDKISKSIAEKKKTLKKTKSLKTIIFKRKSGIKTPTTVRRWKKKIEKAAFKTFSGRGRTF